MKILVVFTGGTISCSQKGGTLSPNPSDKFALLDMYKKSGHNADNFEFETREPYTILSENLQAKHLNALADLLCEVMNSETNTLDGVIITHGTDTLQYTAAFLSFLFADYPVPIVLVSANYPLDNERSNGLENFSGAVDFIKYCSETCNIKGVFAAYKNSGEAVKIHRGSRLLAHAAYSDSLQSVFNMYFGVVNDEVFAKNPDYKAAESKFCFDKSARLSNESGVLKISSCVGAIYPELTPNTKAVLFEGFHSGTLNTSSNAMKRFCANACQAEIPVFLAGADSNFPYESKRAFSALGIVSLPAASPVAMYVKLWLLNKNDFGRAYLPCAEEFAEAESGRQENFCKF